MSEKLFLEYQQKLKSFENNDDRLRRINLHNTAYLNREMYLLIG